MTAPSYSKLDVLLTAYRNQQRRIKRVKQKAITVPLEDEAKAQSMAADGLISFEDDGKVRPTELYVPDKRIAVIGRTPPKYPVTLDGKKFDAPVDSAFVDRLNKYSSIITLRFDPAAFQVFDFSARPFEGGVIPKSCLQYSRKFKGNDKRGARWYCHVQNLPERIRLSLTMNGARVNELDFGCFHPTMLYAKVGKSMPPDPYCEKQLGKTLGKKAWNTLLNGRGDYTDPEIIKKLSISKKFGFDAATEALSLLREKHAAIAHMFCTDQGSYLQYEDSEMMRGIMLRLMDSGLKFVAVHDSLIVPAHHKNLVKKIMAEEFKSRFGVEIEIKEKGLN